MKSGGEALGEVVVNLEARWVMDEMSLRNFLVWGEILEGEEIMEIFIFCFQLEPSSQKKRCQIFLEMK